MNYITLVLFFCTSVLCAPIEKIENGDKREKKSPQLNLLSFSPIAPSSPFDPLLDLGLAEDLQFKNANKAPSDEFKARSYYESGNSGAVGLFPSAKPALGAIPLLLSCAPSVVSGQLSSSVPLKPLYKRDTELRTTENEPSSFKQRSNIQQLENIDVNEKQLSSGKKVARSVDEQQLEKLKGTPNKLVLENSKDIVQPVLKLRLKVEQESSN